MSEEAQHKPLSSDQIQNILTSRKPKGILTEPREIGVWYKLNHMLRQDGCSNPNCIDPRPKGDRGRNIVVKINDEYVCRYCFLDGWLSSAKVIDDAE